MTIRTLLIGVPAMFAGWLIVLVMVGLITDEAPASVVLFPSPEFVDALPHGTSILESTRFSVTLRSDASGFVRSLYESGAIIVLPAGLPGCLPLPKTGTYS